MLSVADALNIALAWREQLRNKVRLDRDSANSYAWVCFHVSLQQRQQVSAARAASVVWLVLSRCRGYSGRTNPSFWKRVFSELWRARIDTGGHTLEEADLQSITDADAFFESEEHTFPRFRLHVSPLHGAESESSVRLFCGCPGEELEQEDDVKLKRLLYRLRPWIQDEHPIQSPVVGLSCTEAFGFDKVHPDWHNHPLGPALIRLLDTVNSVSTASLSATTLLPVFRISEISFPRVLVLYDSADVDMLAKLLTETDITIDISDCIVPKTTTIQAQAELVRALLRTPGSNAVATSPTLKLCSGNQFMLPAFASALPFSTSVEAVQLTALDPLDYHALVWIAYALFHPDTSVSLSWKQLELLGIDLDERCVAALRAMARGNNVAALLQDKAPRSDGYYSATLAPHTRIYSQPIRTWWQRFTTPLLVSSAGDGLAVDVCGVATEHTTQWEDWVAVVVPAYGLGWVRSAQVLQVHKRSPSASPSITSLCITSGGPELRDDEAAAVAAVLSVLGARLERLDVRRYCRFPSPDDLRQALIHCPALQSLAVAHGGGLWSGKCITPAPLPHLRELQLCLTDEEEAPAKLFMTTVPDSLEALRVTAFGWQGLAYENNRDVVQTLLAQSHRNLRVFHWQEGLLMRCTTHEPMLYTESCAETARRLELLGFSQDQCRYLKRSLSSGCAAAFLSVVRRAAACADPLARLDNCDVLQVILQYAGSCVPRAITLEPSELPRESPRSLLRTD